jgi:hypothetical protein
MKANSATLGYLREGTVMCPWPPATPSQDFLPAQHASRRPRVAEQHQISPAAEEWKQKQAFPGKRISVILGYELDDCTTKDKGITYYSQERWKHVSDNFLHVRPEDEVEPTGCTVWIFSYSTDFSTSGMNWKNDKKEIMFHLRRLPDKIALHLQMFLFHLQMRVTTFTSDGLLSVSMLLDSMLHGVGKYSTPSSITSRGRRLKNLRSTLSGKKNLSGKIRIGVLPYRRARRFNVYL